MECTGKLFPVHGLDWDFWVHLRTKTNESKKANENSDMTILLGMCMELVDTSTVCCNRGKKTMIPSPARTSWHLMHHYKKNLSSFFVLCLWISLGKQGSQQHPYPTSWTWLDIIGGGDRDSLAVSREQQQLDMSHVFFIVQLSKPDVVSVGKTRRSQMKMWK